MSNLPVIILFLHIIYYIWEIILQHYKFSIMRNVLFSLLMLCCISAVAQKKVTFKIEKLSKPEELLDLHSHNEIYERLILSDMDLAPYRVKQDNLKIPYNILAKSEAPDSLVSYGYNSFFNGMYQAYADHRPFVLSPDIIWLLISQGFAQHINANQETMRHYFADFSGKLSLIVSADKKPDDPALAWEGIFSKFTGQIQKYAGNNLTELLTCNFSTTTPVEKIASEITIMETVKPYFEFIIIRVVCGIPEITLEGTPEDWEKVLDKAQKLKGYELEWWISELEPLLNEFVKASKGEVNKEFWRNMFKCHSQEKYGVPDTIDGWIVKFFPYDKEGKRNNLKQLERTNCLPDEIVKVDLKYQEIYSDTVKSTPLELWAGFIGLKQNKKNFALRPQIGWMVRKKDVRNDRLKNKLSADSQKDGWGNGIVIRVKEFPSVLLELKEIKRLEIRFIDKVDIPDEISKIKIGNLVLYGKVTKEEIGRIKALLPSTDIKINGSRI